MLNFNMFTKNFPIHKLYGYTLLTWMYVDIARHCKLQTAKLICETEPSEL